MAEGLHFVFRATVLSVRLRQSLFEIRTDGEMLFIHLSHWNVSNHMKIVQEIEILEDSITWTVPSGPSRPGSFMISTISSMMLFSPGNIWWYYIISCICFIEELLQYLAFWIQSSLMILRTDQTYYYWSSQCRNPCLWMNNSSSS